MVSAHEIDVLARTVYGEARGDTYAGKLAVAHCIMNRVKADLGNDDKPDWWGEGVIGCCVRDRQFSCWNHNDPNRVKLMEVTLDDPVFAKCMVAAIEAAHGLKPDPTEGADHYCTYAVNPDWAEGKPYVSIGKHRFYRLAHTAR